MAIGLRLHGQEIPPHAVVYRTCIGPAVIDTHLAQSNVVAMVDDPIHVLVKLRSHVMDAKLLPNKRPFHDKCINSFSVLQCPLL